MTPTGRVDSSQWVALGKTAVFFVVAPGTVAGYIPCQILQRWGTSFEAGFGLLQLLGAGGILLGVAGLLWCGWHFATEGRGTPAYFDPPKALVVRGPYRWVGNPMYVCVATILLGEALFFRSTTLLGYVAFCWVIVQLFVVLYEEPTLRAQFGESYVDYCRRVWRWIPRPPRQ